MLLLVPRFRLGPPALLLLTKHHTLCFLPRTRRLTISKYSELSSSVLRAPLVYDRHLNPAFRRLWGLTRPPKLRLSVTSI